MSQSPGVKRTYLFLAGRRMLRTAGAVHCTAEGERLQATKWAPSANWVVAPCLVDIESFTRIVKPPSKSGRCGVLFLGRLHPKKGVEILIDAVALLAEQGVVTHTVLAGPADAAYAELLRSRVAARGLAKAVEFAGMVTGDAKVAALRDADVFVLPTSQENFGISLVEAMAAATPVVTTRGVDIWAELASAGARVVDRSAEAVATAIRELVGQPGLAAELGRRGREWVLAELSPQRVLSRYCDLYESAIARG